MLRIECRGLRLAPVAAAPPTKASGSRRVTCAVPRRSGRLWTVPRSAMACLAPPLVDEHPKSAPCNRDEASSAPST